MFIDYIFNLFLVIAACAIVAGAFTLLYCLAEWARFAFWVAYDEYRREHGKQPKRG